MATSVTRAPSTYGPEVEPVPVPAVAPVGESVELEPVELALELDD